VVLREPIRTHVVQHGYYWYQFVHPSIINPN
jgi:hypothetical protein